MTAKKQNLGLDSISALENVSDVPDSQTQLESKTLESEELRARVAKLNQDIELRKEYSGKLFCLISVWLIAMFLLLLLKGFLSHFNLSDKVLMTIIGGTTINVLGLFAIVANYIFPKENAVSRVTKKR